MRVGVLGINHKLANLQLRERLAAICHQRLALGSSIHGEHQFILLSTCNRTEIYFFSEDLTATHSYLLGMLRQDVSDEFDQKLYSYFGQDCLMHLCRVATGLDSAIIVETEIQGQVKSAYENVQRHYQLPFELHYLFQKALAISKKVRAILPSQAGLPDIEHAIFHTGRHFFPEYSSPNILFVGASSINEKIISYFKRKQVNRITLCNRTESKAAVMAEKYQIPLLHWRELSKWPNYDWVILGTKATGHLLQIQHVDFPVERKLIVDLSVPRNAEPQLGHLSSITLLNIDQLNCHLKIRTQGLVKILHQAEEMILQSVQQHVARFNKPECVQMAQVH